MTADPSGPGLDFRRNWTSWAVLLESTFRHLASQRFHCKAGPVSLPQLTETTSRNIPNSLAHCALLIIAIAKSQALRRAM